MEDDISPWLLSGDRFHRIKQLPCCGVSFLQNVSVALTLIFSANLTKFRPGESSRGSDAWRPDRWADVNRAVESLDRLVLGSRGGGAPPSACSVWSSGVGRCISVVMT